MEMKVEPHIVAEGRVARHDRREWMGVEPTVAALAAPTTDFEDRGAHRDSTTPT